MGKPSLEALADRGYFNGEDIMACERASITPLVPKPLTSNAKAEGRFDKPDFIYIPRTTVSLSGGRAPDAASRRLRTA